jgi:hypothetical protein
MLNLEIEDVCLSAGEIFIQACKHSKHMRRDNVLFGTNQSTVSTFCSFGKYSLFLPLGYDLSPPQRLYLFLCRLRSSAQRLRSCSKIRRVKCSEMYLIVILNPKKTKASAEERGL